MFKVSHNITQTKLNIGKPDDKFEREADMISDQVMAMPQSPSPIQRKCEDSNEGTLQMKVDESTPYKMIQKQDEEPLEISPDPVLPSLPGPLLRPRSGFGFNFNLAPPSLLSSFPLGAPILPSFCPPGSITCLISQFKENIDENLAANAHHFYRIGSLFPDDPEMLQNAFFRYGVGLNLLETSFRFIGVDDDMVTPVSLATGIILKGVTFVKDGAFVFDYQYELPNGLNLEFSIDLQGDPENLDDPSSYNINAGVGLIGTF